MIKYKRFIEKTARHLQKILRDSLIEPRRGILQERMVKSFKWLDRGAIQGVSKCLLKSECCDRSRYLNGRQINEA